MTDIPEIECPDCDGEGRIWNNADPTSGQSVDCEECRGTGWRTMTADECEDAYTAQFEGEPPLSAQERREIAWKQKQELRR